MEGDRSRRVDGTKFILIFGGKEIVPGNMIHFQEDDVDYGMESNRERERERVSLSLLLEVTCYERRC